MFNWRNNEGSIPSLGLLCEFVHALIIHFKMPFGKKEKIAKTIDKDEKSSAGTLATKPGK